MVNIRRLLEEKRRERLKENYTLKVNNFRIADGSQIARFKDFISPLNQDAGYGIGNVEDGCKLDIDLEAKQDKTVIKISLNKDLASNVLECTKKPENEIVCCLTTDYKNLDFLCKNGEKYTALFRISLVRPENKETMRLGELLSNDGGSSFREIALAYASDKGKISFKDYLITDHVGHIDKPYIDLKRN